MEIRTKFNVGDKVWVILQFDNTIVLRTITTIIYENGKVLYSMGNRDIAYTETQLFTTKEQAQKECDRRNAQK